MFGRESRPVRGGLSEEGLSVPCDSRHVDRPADSRRSSPPWQTHEHHAFGGHLEPCEEPSTALARELEEELGIRVADPRFLGIYEDVDPTSKETFRHYLFLVTRWDGEPRITNEEHSEIHWFPPEDVDSLSLAASIRESIHRVLPRKA